MATLYGWQDLQSYIWFEQASQRRELHLLATQHPTPGWVTLDAPLWGSWLLAGCQYLIFKASTALLQGSSPQLNDSLKYSFDLRWKEFE